MAAVTLPDGITCTGPAIFTRDVSVPAGSFGNTEMDAGDPVTCPKMYARHQAMFSQVYGSDMTTERRVVHIAQADGTINGVKAQVTVAATGDDTAAVDVLVNGVSALSSPIGFSKSDTAGSVKAGVIGTAAYTAGSRIEVTAAPTHNTGTLPRGLGVAVDLFERPV